jgi:hypothetical protein
MGECRSLTDSPCHEQLLPFSINNHTSAINNESTIKDHQINNDYFARAACQFNTMVTGEAEGSGAAPSVFRRKRPSRVTS